MSIYEDGAYLKRNHNWHIEDSAWKAQQVVGLLKSEQPKTVAEVGCGAGEILAQLANHLPETAFFGFELSPQAIALAEERRSDRVQFHLEDISRSGRTFDALLVLDVIEHVEDCFGFLRSIRPLANIKIFHIPLDCNLLGLLRGWPMLQARRDVGHIHYFFKDTAIALLSDCGYEICSASYTATALETPGASKSFKAQLMNCFRRLLFSASPDTAVRLFGGYSLLVLAK